MYLLDTNVLSELRKGRSRVNAHVLAWQASVQPEQRYLSVITVLELERGILNITPSDPAQSTILRSWLDNRILPSFRGRILTVDLNVAKRCAALHVPNKRPAHDALIAATALVHGMTVVTRNVADFAPTNVPILNPWKFQA